MRLRFVRPEAIGLVFGQVGVVAGATGAGELGLPLASHLCVTLKRSPLMGSGSAHVTRSRDWYLLRGTNTVVVVRRLIQTPKRSLEYHGSRRLLSAHWRKSMLRK